MAQVDIITTSGSKSGTVSLKKSKPLSPIMISNVVLANLSNKRRARAHTKTRAEVSGGGKKPWRQKGTGQARAGSSRSPIWVGGGITFGPRKERNFYKRVNRKQGLLVINDTLIKKLESGNLKILENPMVDSGKTKEMVALLTSLGVDGNAILILDKELSESPDGEKIYNAGRNLSFLDVLSLDKLNAYMLLKTKWVLITKKALDQLNNKFDFIKEAGGEDKKLKKEETKKNPKVGLEEKSVKKTKKDNKKENKD